MAQSVGSTNPGSYLNKRNHAKIILDEKSITIHHFRGNVWSCCTHFILLYLSLPSSVL